MYVYVLYVYVTPSTTKLEPRPDDTYPWSEELSDEIIYEVAAQISREEEQKDSMNPSELSATFYTPFEYKQTVEKLKQRNCLTHYQNNGS